MSKYEKKLAKDRLLKMGPSERLFRCNAGMAFTGRFLSAVGGITKLANAMRIKLLPKGTPDFCGWKSVVVTEDMVGKTVAVFMGEEHKATKSDKMRPDQIIARDLMVKMGAIHREVRHDGEVIESCAWKPQ